MLNPSPTGFPAALARQALESSGVRAGEGMRVLGIGGLQGSGKSTLAAQVVAVAAATGLCAAAVSLDDFYLTAAQRRALARKVHPLLATRGPPGTHEVALALETVDALRDGRTRALPRFDKLGDDRLPPRDWPRPPRPLDLLVLEGWCLCVPAQPERALDAPLNALEREEDADGRWRRFCNAALGRDYPPLWSRVDVLWFLQPPGFEAVREWRWQQERALQAAQAGRAGMDRARLERFIQHYERVSRQALRTLPGIADTRVVLDARRLPQSVRARPGGD
ncbi:kinase [Pseudoxanthomonas broegbernensis]|uniref:Kinase n=1 Tax=Pseudoxanthomonas broegbernensis TaxID=83619 RepID=A0A7V8K5R7_9GAMM|nr:kinase [Pseudoxanthomonas broegbernensis]KAF1684763.1 kinase [Pseudoxanthomonas broegbernensis]MBB6064183.1 D-glycerate 3-kinase [Pseudoxanthomonas broegbernensis]